MIESINTGDYVLKRLDVGLKEWVGLTVAWGNDRLEFDFHILRLDFIFAVDW